MTTATATRPLGAHGGEQVPKNKKWDDVPPRVAIPAERAFVAGTVFRPDGTIAADTVRFVDDDAAPLLVDVVVPLARYLAAHAALSASGGKVGVSLQATDDARALTDKLGAVSRVVLHTAKFRDGRLYSQAAVVRQIGYTGTLRARGDLIADQVFFLRRIGFDEIELRAGEDTDVARRALTTWTVTYQPSSDDRRPVGRAARGA